MNMQGNIGDQFVCLVSEVRDRYFTNSPLLFFPANHFHHATTATPCVWLVQCTVCSSARMCVSTIYCSHNITKRKHSFHLYRQLHGERNVTVLTMTFSSFGKSYKAECRVSRIPCMNRKIVRDIQENRRSRYPRGLGRGSAAVRLLGLRVRIPPGSRLSVTCVMSVK